MKPRPYQIAGRDFLAARRHALLADEMRVGKTCQAIMACEAVFAVRVLVVCPAIAVEVWQQQWKLWSTRAVQLTVLSFEKAKIHADSLRIRWDVVIVDECHRAKNPEAQTTKLIYGKNGLGWYASRLWALSGTPAPKHAGELWPMLRAFDVVKMTYDEFIAAYCTIHPFTGRVTGTKVDRIPELRALLAKIMLRRMRKDVAPEMPDIGFEFLPVEVSCDLQVPENLTEDQLVCWMNANQPDTEDRLEVALAKVRPLVENISDAIESEQLTQTVVFGHHKQPLRDVADALGLRGYLAEVLNGDTSPSNRERIQKGFRDGVVQVVCANIQAAGTAIDLSSASHGYFLELDWVPGNNMQAANRLVSIGKNAPVTFDVVTMPGSFDDRVQRSLVRRASQVKQLLQQGQ